MAAFRPQSGRLGYCYVIHALDVVLCAQRDFSGGSDCGDCGVRDETPDPGRCSCRRHFFHRRRGARGIGRDDPAARDRRVRERLRAPCRGHDRRGHHRLRADRRLLPAHDRTRARVRRQARHIHLHHPSSGRRPVGRDVRARGKRRRRHCRLLPEQGRRAARIRAQERRLHDDRRARRRHDAWAGDRGRRHQQGRRDRGLVHRRRRRGTRVRAEPGHVHDHRRSRGRRDPGHRHRAERRRRRRRT